MPHHSKAPIFKGANAVPMLAAFAVTGILWIIPEPSGIKANAWHLFAIFAGLITGLIGKALPMGGMSFLALTAAILTRTLTIPEALSGFSHSVVWLIVAAFFISRSVIKTGLGMRLAYHFVALLGKKKA